MQIDKYAASLFICIFFIFHSYDVSFSKEIPLSKNINSFYIKLTEAEIKKEKSKIENKKDNHIATFKILDAVTFIQNKEDKENIIGMIYYILYNFTENMRPYFEHKDYDFFLSNTSWRIFDVYEFQDRLYHLTNSYEDFLTLINIKKHEEYVKTLAE